MKNLDLTRTKKNAVFFQISDKYCDFSLSSKHYCQIGSKKCSMSSYKNTILLTYDSKDNIQGHHRIIHIMIYIYIHNYLCVYIYIYPYMYKYILLENGLLICTIIIILVTDILLKCDIWTIHYCNTNKLYHKDIYSFDLIILKVLYYFLSRSKNDNIWYTCINAYLFLI